VARCVRPGSESIPGARRQLGPCVRDVGNTSATRALRPNNSFNRTRYGKRRKPGLRHLVHHLSPGLRHLPPQAG
jgi:hypothetical protein